jgi:catechol 2,3-dioxygenase-like lactoylglutathione lyase family enzyme
VSVPAIQRVVESALYCEDVARAVAFYRDVLGLTVMSQGPRLAALDAGGATVLLLFHRGATAQGLDFSGGRVPPHDGAGPTHLAFAVGEDDLDAWEQRLAGHGVAIESRAQWTLGGRSIYFRDPDQHSLELVTPRTWPNY